MPDEGGTGVQEQVQVGVRCGRGRGRNTGLGTHNMCMSVVHVNCTGRSTGTAWCRCRRVVEVYKSRLPVKRVQPVYMR